MKKFLSLFFVVVLFFVVAGCKEEKDNVMSYDEYLAAELDSEVVVETYVQAKQSWWDNKGTFYTQNEEGAYFIYNMAVTEEEYNKLTPGTKIRVEGYKAAWSGEVEIINAKYTILEGNFIATAEDVTSLLGTEGLVNKQNILAAFKGLEVTKEATYKADGSGKEGDDLYFGVRVNGNEYTFTVESYLCSKDTEVYQTVKSLKLGDIVDFEGFLYWYEGANPHITKATVLEKAVMSYDEYLAAELDSEVVVETYVQAKQSWWDNKGTFYTQNEEGAYFIYNMEVSEEEYNKLTPGTKIRVEGYKAAWSGEVEIINAKYTILEGNFIATAEDVTSLLGTEGLVNKQNILAAFKGLEVTKEATYKADGSGKEGDDLYFGVRVNGNEYTFTVESYLCSKDTEVYQTVKSLKLGDIVDLEGFLYWYEGANPHITKATKTN